MLIHGFTGDLDMWTQTGTMDLLAGRFRTLAVDCRGHGMSGKPHDAAVYGMAMVDDVVRLLDIHDLGPAQVVGYSMGAEIALRLTTEYPDKVRSLAIGGSGWSVGEDERNYRRVADSLEQEASFGPVIRSMTPAGYPEPPDETITALDQVLQGQDVDALVNVARSMGEIINLSAQALAHIGVPVLGIAGEHDPERPNLEKMVGVVPDYRLRVIAGTDHMSAPSDPQFNESLVEFLADTSA